MEIVALCLLGGALLGALIPGKENIHAPYKVEGEPTVKELDYLFSYYVKNNVKRKSGMNFDEYVEVHRKMEGEKW